MLVTVFCICAEVILFSVERFRKMSLLASAGVRSLGWAVYVGMCAVAARADHASALDALASLTLCGAGLGQFGIAAYRWYSITRGKNKTQDSRADEGTALSDLGAYAPVGTAPTS